jgi:hypothetical protein
VAGVPLARMPGMAGVAVAGMAVRRVALGHGTVLALPVGASQSGQAQGKN